MTNFGLFFCTLQNGIHIYSTHKKINITKAVYYYIIQWAGKILNQMTAISRG